MNDNQNELIIEPGRGIRHYWRDLWQYRELFYKESADQGLFPPDHRSCQFGYRRPGRFLHLPGYPRWTHGLVRFRPGLADHLAPSVSVPGTCLCLWLRTLDFGAQCAIPGFPVCGAVHDPVRAVYLPGRFQQQHRAGTVAHALLPQSHGRSHRRVPLGHYRQNRYNLLAGVLALRSIGGTDLYKWFLVFQKNGKKFC